MRRLRPSSHRKRRGRLTPTGDSVTIRIPVSSGNEPSWIVLSCIESGLSERGARLSLFLPMVDSAGGGSPVFWSKHEAQMKSLRSRLLPYSVALVAVSVAALVALWLRHPAGT